MKASRWLTGTALVVALGLGAALFFLNRRVKDSTAHGARADHQAEQLRSEVAALQAKVRRLSAQKDSPAPSAVTSEKPAAANDETPVSDDSAEPSKLTLKDVLADVPPEQEESFLRELERKGNRVRKARTLEQLRSEPRDAAWTREVEDLVTNASGALNRQEFPSARVTSIECGSTLCKIEVDQDSAAEQSQFAGALHTGLRTYGVRRGGPDDPAGEKLGWTLFVARKGHKMPKVPLEEILAQDT